jgi:hypothetical protein
MTTVVRPIHFVRRGKSTKAVSAPDAAPKVLPRRVPRVARLMALAIHFDGMLRKGVLADQSELAQICEVTQPRITQIGTCCTSRRTSRSDSCSSHPHRWVETNSPNVICGAWSRLIAGIHSECSGIS